MDDIVWYMGDVRMKKILFKAKRKDNGEWAKGSLFLENYDCKIIRSQCNSPGIEGVDVEQETICQYTGLNDRNGNMIWENDILISGEPYIPTIPFSVRFNCKTLAFVGFYDDYEKEFPLNADLLSSCEVLGNIFDNKTE